MRKFQPHIGGKVRFNHAVVFDSTPSITIFKLSSNCPFIHGYLETKFKSFNSVPLVEQTKNPVRLPRLPCGNCTVPVAQAAPTTGSWCCGSCCKRVGRVIPATITRRIGACRRLPLPVDGLGFILYGAVGAPGATAVGTVLGAAATATPSTCRFLLMFCVGCGPMLASISSPSTLFDISALVYHLIRIEVRLCLKLNGTTLWNVQLQKLGNLLLRFKKSSSKYARNGLVTFSEE